MASAGAGNAGGRSHAAIAKGAAITTDDYIAAVIELIASTVEPDPVVTEFSGFVINRIDGPGREYELDPNTQAFEEHSAAEVLMNICEEAADIVAYAEQLRQRAPALTGNARRLVTLSMTMAHVLAACATILEEGH